MELTNEWTKIGEIKGRVGLLTRQLRYRFGESPPELPESIGNLTGEKADDFAEAVFDFKSLADVQAWLVRA
jgi:hypothetical protein